MPSVRFCAKPLGQTSTSFAVKSVSIAEDPAYFTYLTDAREGRGPLGDLVKKYNLDQRYQDNKQKITDWAKNAGGGAVSVAGKFFQGIVSLVTVLVLAVLMVLYGPELLESGLGILFGPRLHPRHQRGAAFATKLLQPGTGTAQGPLSLFQLRVPGRDDGLDLFHSMQFHSLNRALTC